MAGLLHVWWKEVEELVSVERWSCGRGASCVVKEVEELVSLGKPCPLE